jgi:hypothetical protein
MAFLALLAFNLGVCVGPSMLWPKNAEDVLKNDVPQLVEVSCGMDGLAGAMAAPLFHAPRSLLRPRHPQNPPLFSLPYLHIL